MADPKARVTSVRFANGKGGTVTGTIGLLEYLFGTQFNEWTAPPTGSVGPSGRRRRKYGSRQRCNARPGKPCIVYLDNGENYTLRTTGADIDFLDFLIGKVGAKVLRVCTPRGTTYSKQFPASVI